MCACRPCYLLFTHGQAGRGRYRSVPDRYLVDPDRPMTAAEWDMLDIPVGLAFFLRSSAAGEVTGFYPSPAGATQCRLDLAAWDRLAADHPLLAAIAPDVEAALICRTDDGVEHFLVPVDACYELAGRMRLHWRGFDGGEQARQSIAEFLEPGALPGAALGRGGGVRASTGAGALTWPSLPSTASGPRWTGTRWCRPSRWCCGSARPAASRWKRSRCGARSGSSRPGAATRPWKRSG